MSRHFELDVGINRNIGHPVCEVRKKSVRNRLTKWLFGYKRSFVIIAPSEFVREVRFREISETAEE